MSWLSEFNDDAFGIDKGTTLSDKWFSPEVAPYVDSLAWATIVGSMPPGIQDFFNSDIGQAAAQMFGITGGGSGFTGWLDGIGITGKGKDILEDVLTYIALAEAGQLIAQDAIDLANEYETREQAAIKGLSDAAQKYSDPAQLEKAKAMAVEETRNIYGRKTEEMERDLAARGLGNRTVGPEASLQDAAARAELEAMRNTELDWTNKGMQANAYAVGPIQTAAERARNTANEQQRIPFDFYESILSNQHNSPADDYYRAQLAQMQQQQSGGGGGGIDVGGVISGIAGAANAGANTAGGGYINPGGTGIISTSGLDLSGGASSGFGFDTAANNAPTIPDLDIWQKRIQARRNVPKFAIRPGV